MAEYLFDLYGPAPAGKAWATSEGALLIDGVTGDAYVIASPANLGDTIEIAGGEIEIEIEPADPVVVFGECPKIGALVEAEINKLATQYREATKFQGYIRAVLGEVENAIRATCAIPTFFDLDTATGDQLTLLGKRLGWPRCHCVCDVAPVFGFDCGPNPLNLQIVGFCEGGTWANCDEVGQGQICLDDDEVYRGFLRARRYQMLGLYDIASLQTALRHVWGPTANVANTTVGKVVLSPGRVLTPIEVTQLPLVVRIMPIALGVKATVFLGGGNPIFGFGEGWGGFCEGAEWLCEVDPNAYACG